MNLNLRNAIEHDDLQKLALKMANEAVWIFDSGLEEHDITKRQLKTAIDHYSTWTKHQNDLNRLKISVCCLAFAFYGIVESSKTLLPASKICTLKAMMSEYAEIRNEAGYFLLHPTKGYVRLIKTSGQLRYQQSGDSESFDNLDVLLDPPFAQGVFMHKGKMIFEPTGPVCPSIEAFLKSVMLDSDHASEAYQAREQAEVTVCDPDKWGYLSLDFHNPGKIYGFVLFLEEYFQKWMTKAHNSGLLAELFKDSQEGREDAAKAKSDLRSDQRLTTVKPANVIKVCAFCNDKGEIIRQIPPQFKIDDLHAEIAEWACGEFIPTSFAQQAVVNAMVGKGYSIIWYALEPVKKQNQ